jgi:hypothetical protein
MEYQKIERGADFDLFSATAGCQRMGEKRKASDDECRAYARWLAMKGGIVEAVTKSPVLKWRAIGRNRKDRICIGAHFGAAFVAFPGADDNGAVTFELLDDAGEVATASTIYCKPNGALNITAGDVAAIKESGKAWVKANKAKRSPVATPTAEPAPVATVLGELDSDGLPDTETCEAMLNDALANHFAGEYETTDTNGNIWLHRRDGSQELVHDETGDAMANAVEHAKLMQDSWQSFQDEYLTPQTPPEAPIDPAPATTLANEPEIASCEAEIAPIEAVEAAPDVIAALVARIEALEAMIINATTIEAANVIDPIGEIQDTAPLSVQSKPKRTPAHVRAIMAYLKLRRERVYARGTFDRFMAAQDRAYHAIKGQSDLEMKRRRAVLKAREIMQRLCAEHKLVDRHGDKRREAEQCARDMSIKEQAQRERADRAETALAAVQARADGWPPAVRSLNVNFRMAA